VWREQVRGIRDQCSAIDQKLVRPGARCAGHWAGNSSGGAIEFVRVPGNRHGTGSSTGFNHDRGCGERRHQSCASEEVVPGGYCSRWYLTGHETEADYRG